MVISVGLTIAEGTPEQENKQPAQMNSRIKNLLVAMVSMGTITAVHAVPTLNLTDGTTLVSATDIDADGIVTYSGSVGVWNVVVTTGVTKPAFGSATNPVMDVAIQAQTLVAGPHTLWVSFSENGYTALGQTLLANLSGSIVSGAPETISYSVFGNTANTVATLNAAGALQNGGTLIGTSGTLNVPVISSFSGPLPATAPYALTELLVLNTTGATRSSLDGGFSTAPDAGSTLLLLGAGLTAMGFVGRRSKKAS